MQEEFVMKRYFLASLGFLLVLGTACAPVTPAVPTVTAATSASTPTVPVVTAAQPAAPSEAYHPLDTQTGIAQVDRILDAVASGDPQVLRSLVEFTELACTHGEGFGGPPKCREGEEEGTPVRTLAFLGSEGGHIREEEIEQWIGVTADGIYAVYEVSAEVYADEYFPAGRYAIVLLNPEDLYGTILRVGESGIVRVDTLFDISPESLKATLEREAETVILAPINE
jgi:hypothetical protein